MKSFNPERDKKPRWCYRVQHLNRLFVQRCLTNLFILKSTGIQPDDSWKRPLQPGGKTALYARYTQAEK